MPLYVLKCTFVQVSSEKIHSHFARCFSKSGLVQGLGIFWGILQYKHSKTHISCLADFEEFLKLLESSIGVLAVFL